MMYVCVVCEVCVCDQLCIMYVCFVFVTCRSHVEVLACAPHCALCFVECVVVVSPPIARGSLQSVGVRAGLGLVARVRVRVNVRVRVPVDVGLGLVVVASVCVCICIGSLETLSRPIVYCSAPMSARVTASVGSCECLVVHRECLAVHRAMRHAPMVHVTVSRL